MHPLFVNTPCHDSIRVRELGLVMHAMEYTMTPWEAGHSQWKLPTGQPQLHHPILITRRKIMSSNGLLKTGGNNVVPGCQQY